MKISKMIIRWPFSYLLRTPYTCNIKITQRCNLRCSFCGLWKNPSPRELHLVNYRFMADLLQKAGAARVVITGGEPFLRPDLPEIIALFARRGFSMTLLTNGTLVTPWSLEHLHRIGLHDIGISLDSLDPGKQDKICQGTGVWGKAVNAIRHAVSVFRKGFVEVLITVSDMNLDEIPDLVHFISSDLKAWAVVNPVNIPGSKEALLSAKKGESAPPLDHERVDRVYDRLLSMKHGGAKILVSNVFLEASRKYLKTGDYQWHCDAGERYFTIFADGSLAPCSDVEPVANILTMKPSDFRETWFREKVKRTQRMCGGCIFSCWREASYLFTEPGVWIERMNAVYRTRFT